MELLIVAAASCSSSFIHKTSDCKPTEKAHRHPSTPNPNAQLELTQLIQFHSHRISVPFGRYRHELLGKELQRHGGWLVCAFCAALRVPVDPV